MRTIIILVIAFLFRGSALSQLAKLIGAILNPLNSILVAVINRNRHGFVKEFNKLQTNDALETDIFLHHNLRTLWNFTLSSKGWKFKQVGYKFGTKGETLSSAIGHKAEEKTLSIAGWSIWWILYLIDIVNISKGGHCKVAYESYKSKKL